MLHSVTQSKNILNIGRSVLHAKHWHKMIDRTQFSPKASLHTTLELLCTESSVVIFFHGMTNSQTNLFMQWLALSATFVVYYRLLNFNNSWHSMNTGIGMKRLIQSFFKNVQFGEYFYLATVLVQICKVDKICSYGGRHIMHSAFSKHGDPKWQIINILNHKPLLECTILLNVHTHTHTHTLPHFCFRSR